MAKKDSDIVNPALEGFKEKITPKDPTEQMFFFTCPECGGQHFRHAGYVQIMLPYMRPGNEKVVGVEGHVVNLCVKCKHAYLWVNEQMYDVTDRIDLEAWEKTEVEAYKATGPGGQC